MIVLDANVVLEGKRFEMMFAGKGGGGIGGILAVVENSATGMVDEDGPTCEALFLAAVRGVEAAGEARDVVVGRHAVSRIEMATFEADVRPPVETLTEGLADRCRSGSWLDGSWGKPMGLCVKTAGAFERGDVAGRPSLNRRKERTAMEGHG